MPNRSNPENRHALSKRGQDHCASSLTIQDWWAEQARGHAENLGTQKWDGGGWHCLSPIRSKLEQWGTGYLHEIPEPGQQVRCMGTADPMQGLYGSKRPHPSMSISGRKGWQKNRFCLKHYKDLHLKPKLEFHNQNILCVSINFHLKKAVPIVSTGYSGVNNSLQKPTAFSIKEESQEQKNPGLLPIRSLALMVNKARKTYIGPK